jgi:Peptidase family M23
MLGAAMLAPLSASDAAAQETPPEVITPLVANPLSSPHPVVGSDRRVHLAYELFVTNPTQSVMKLEKLETLGAGGRNSLERGARIIAALTDQDLDGATKPFVPGSTLTLAPAQVTRLFLDARFARTARLPRWLKHRFTFTLTPTDGAPSTQTVVSGYTRVIDDAPVVIGPPLAGRRWVVAAGCCSPASYHRTATLPVNGIFHSTERFAIDFIQLLPDNRLISGPVSDLQSYKYFGANVLSVAAGVVVGRQDGQPEQTPPNFPPDTVPPALNGNYVVIKMGRGRYAFYAHMQPRSLRVRMGQRVKRGQVLGRLGNTGNSDAPHLHFQIMNGPGPLSSDGLPFELRSFVSRGTITSPLDERFFLQGEPAVIGPVNRGRHRSQLPLNNEVIDFHG